MKLIKPNFSKNIINISSSLELFLNGSTDKPTLKKLDKAIHGNYKNIVFIIFDGLGINPLKINLNKGAFLRKKCQDSLTSVFPSTTTNATTSIITNKYPLEHGWFGWCLYFEEIKKVVDLFLATDSYTKEKIDSSFVNEKLPTIPFYKSNHSPYIINRVVPSYFNDGILDNKYEFKDLETFFDTIFSICQKEGKQFIYAYNPEPDHTMHEYGVSSIFAKQAIVKINDYMEKLFNQSKDTLFIISADHGQVDIDGYENIYLDEEILKMIEWPFFLEARAMAVKLKDEYKHTFKRQFNHKYHHDFKIYDVKTLINHNYFGPLRNKEHEKLLGDYIIIAKGHKMFRLNDYYNYHLGHHGSLTKEMLVPLIILKTNKKK